MPTECLAFVLHQYVPNDMQRLGCQQHVLPGAKEWSIAGSANFSFDATYGYEDLWDLWDAQTAVTPIFQTAVAGDLKWSGSSYIEELNATSDGVDAAVEYDVTFRGTGTLTKATVA